MIVVIVCPPDCTDNQTGQQPPETGQKQTARDIRRQMLLGQNGGQDDQEQHNQIRQSEKQVFRPSPLEHPGCQCRKADVQTGETIIREIAAVNQSDKQREEMLTNDIRTWHESREGEKDDECDCFAQADSQDLAIKNLAGLPVESQPEQNACHIKVPGKIRQDENR